MSEHLRSPLSVNLARFVSEAIASDNQQRGQSLPCTVKSVQGLLVTVNFEITSSYTYPNVTVPVAMFEYALMPVQPGDKGFVIAADALLGVMTGQSSASTTNLGQPTNLGALVFVPLSNTNWTTPDANSVVLTGVNSSGVTLRSGNHSVTFTLTASGIDIELSGGNITINNGTVHVTGGDVIADGIDLKTHRHTAVQPGGGTSGPPVP